MCIVAYLGADEPIPETLAVTEIGYFRLVRETSEAVRRLIATKYVMSFDCFES